MSRAQTNNTVGQVEAGGVVVSRENARAGMRVTWRGRSRVIDEVGDAGVWLQQTPRIIAGKSSNTGRTFIYFSEAAKFKLIVAEGAR